MSDINSGLLNDVLIVGNELSGKLNEIGVSNTFGKASEGKDDLISLIRMAIDGIDMAVDTNSYVSLTATNPYMLTGETTDIVAKLRNGVCRPLPNKNVTIEQSLLIDNGITTTHNDNWTLTSNMQRTRDDSYTTLSNIGSISQMAYPISNNTKFSGDIVIEWENYATTYQLDYFIISGTSDIAKTFGALGINKPCNVKITIIGTTCKCYIDGVEKYSYTFNRDANNQFQVRLQINPNGNDIKYSNFKVYQIINGVTDEKGEFALNDISVTDDTAFIATYETVSDNCLVEHCRFVDYAVKDKHNHNYFNQQGTSKISIIEGDEYKEFKTISTVAGNVYLGSSTGINFDVGDTWTIIYDKLYIDGYNVAFQCYNGSTTVGINSTTLLANNSDFQELKFVCDGSSIKAYVDGVYKTQTSYTSTGHSYLRINVNNNNGASQVTFRAKNIRIK